MVLQRLHGVVQLIWRAGELPRSASCHFDYDCYDEDNGVNNDDDDAGLSS